ncbi:MAG: ATP-binding protein [bacterium]
MLLTLFLLFVQCLLGFYVLLRTSRAKSGFYFAFFCFSLSLWAFAAYMLQHSQNVGEVEFWGKYIFLGPVLIAYYFLNFSFIFPSGEISKKVKLITILPTVVFLFIIPTRLILAKGELALSGPVAIWGAAYPLFALYFLAYFFWGIFNFYKKYQNSKGQERNQIKYVFAGLFLSFIFGILFNLALPALGTSRYVNIGPFFTLILVAFTSYAIVKLRLMDISVVISRAAAELLTIVFLGGIYIGLILAYETFVSSVIGWPFILGSIVYGVIVGETFQGIRFFLQTTSDKLFLRGKYDYYKELSDASSKVGEKLQLPHILGVLYDTFYNVVEISNPKIFLPEKFSEIERTSHCYLVYNKETYKPQPGGQSVDNDSDLVKELIAKRQPLHEVKELGASLVVPCLLEDRLIAFFALGPKMSENAYTDEDLRLLEVLANQVAISLDHTRSYEKIKGDLEIVEKQMERSQRLASLGTLTAGVTHEIRNPLTVIRAEAERIANNERSLEELQKFRDLVLRHIDRIAGIVQRMLSLAKEKPKQITEVNLNELIDATFLCFSLGHITCHKELGQINAIKGDHVELQEVLVNLIQNAVEAMPSGGKLTVKSYMEEGRVAIEVIDTGKGIPDEIKEKIFDPFYSTRHEGTGLGLSIVYRIVREHGGDIKVESEVGKGTTFKLLF